MWYIKSKTKLKQKTMIKIGLPAYGLGRMDYLRGKLKGRSQDRYLQGGGSQEGRYQAMSIHVHEKAQA